MSRASEAYDAGLRPGDVIVGFNGQAIADPSQFLRLVSDAKLGTIVDVKVLRDGRTLEFKLPIVSSASRRAIATQVRPARCQLPCARRLAASTTLRIP